MCYRELPNLPALLLKELDKWEEQFRDKAEKIAQDYGFIFELPGSKSKGISLCESARALCCLCESAPAVPTSRKTSVSKKKPKPPSRDSSTGNSNMDSDASVATFLSARKNTADTGNESSTSTLTRGHRQHEKQGWAFISSFDATGKKVLNDYKMFCSDVLMAQDMHCNASVVASMLQALKGQPGLIVRQTEQHYTSAKFLKALDESYGDTNSFAWAIHHQHVQH